MNTRDKRIEEDISKLKKLKAAYPNLVGNISVKGKPICAVRLSLIIPTVSNKEYPGMIQKSSSIQIELSARYPLTEPKVSVLSPIWNPNVYPSGLICLGYKWLPTEGLDLLVVRVMKLLTFDPLVLNTSSPANYEASRWYIDAKKKYPSAFPTINLHRLMKALDSPTIQWRDIH